MARKKVTTTIYITPEQAELAMIAAWGRHPVLMAGPAGSGKSLMCEVIHGLGSDPDLSAQKDLWRRQQQSQNEDSTGNFWRPFIRPHHSITVQGLIGGGNPIRLGELSRAHHGTLILDELLEFKQSVIESLREPMETSKLRLVRASGFESYDCQFQLLATTNLCPCGDYIPKVPTRCRYSLTKCRSYSQKLTGPLVDRFQLLSFSHRWKGERTVSLKNLKISLQELRDARIFDELDNSMLPEAAFEINSWPLLERKLMEQLQGSHRRFLSTLRVSQTIANLAGKDKPNIDAIEKALKYTVTPFAELQRWD
jgi:magnesium chelatase family protein